MTPSTPQAHDRRLPCNGCGGSGQISFFRGVSRFVMDWDDCPDCLGTGYVEKAENNPHLAQDRQEKPTPEGESSANRNRNPQSES